ncbi:hypothetical protein M406DRAFT_269325 [Cryphonectria parasitica EP155]|uniref:Heterokaryon incompatibility domain-containing protein n=1 Tax=Cryphonectria parasitica (strain ATCC 38755 / EP155) TaxID=660469 RepID=A0A9P4XSZ2_CRYP1|nr:uncharacterized protein M406DRAFT_269325 [Cryphonectria parasitica EP155]KAF3760286.1 hypothetical protein M406DRAFT_269325 [Cryphonectria parasitica EP155]
MLDLKHQCVVSTTFLGKEYATVRYVWGMVAFPKLIRQNVAALSRPGALNPHNPNLAVHRVVKDAMILAKSLGLRYIWVDSLCIVQDEEHDWEYMVPLMDRIYGSGVVNICAAAGQDCSAGLPGTPLNTRGAVQPVITLFEMKLLAVRAIEDVIRRSA